MRSWRISRRTVLRGLGAAVSLPLLEAMVPSSAVASAQAIAPKRSAFLFVPNGVDLEHWTPRDEGVGYDLPTILEPLRTVQDDVCVLTGLTHDKGRGNGDGPGDHGRSAAVFLTGAQPRKTSANDIRVGISVDQVAAIHFGHATKFPSLELGCSEKGRTIGRCDAGYSCVYSDNISWASATTPMAKEDNPRLAFERLFRDFSDQSVKARRERIALRQSLLDHVSDDASRLQKRLGKRDRRKLDEYLVAVRSIEQRIERGESEGPRSMDHGFEQPSGIPEDFDEYLRLMNDMLVLAFQCDLTRIATCMYSRAGSNRSYQMINVPDAHHELSHHQNDAEKLEKIRRINRYHVQHFVYLLERLKAIPEGDGSLLDNCMIVYGSALSDGNRHNHENLPVLLAGRGGGTIRSGRHIRYRTETPMTNLFLSMLDRLDVSVARHGDSTGGLPYLS